MTRPSLLIYLLLICFLSPLSGALRLPRFPPPLVAMDWSGMDSWDGDGSGTFLDPHTPLQAQLRILCNTPMGYHVTFRTAHALSSRRSALVNGRHSLPYTVTMDTSAIRRAVVVKDRLVLNDPSQESLRVHFFGGKPPRNGNKIRSTNLVRFSFKMDGMEGRMVPMGTYSDVMTATISLN